MSNNGAANNGTVKLDFSRLSYGDNIRMATIQSRLMKMQLLQGEILEKQTRGESDIDPAMRDEMKALLDTVPETMQESLNMFAACVAYVPRDWFVASAPAELAFDDPETYKYLRVNRVAELQRMLTEGRTPEALTGN